MKRNQQTFKKVEGSLEIENLSYNYLSKVLTVRNKASPKRPIGLYDNYYDIPEEMWYELLDAEDPAVIINDVIKSVYKHK